VDLPPSMSALRGTIAALAVKNGQKESIHGLFPHRLQFVWDP